MAKEKKKEQRYHNGIPVDSEEEVMMLLWLEELMSAGYILKIERAPTFTLSERVLHRYSETTQLKTKEKVVEKKQILMEDHVYTPEYRIVFGSKGDVLFHRQDSWCPKKITKQFIGRVEQQADYENVAYIEVKPSFDRNNMTRLFVINRKWIMDKHGIFINLIQPHKLFEDTFTPMAWLTTPTGKKRVIHWPVKTMEEYINSLKNSNAVSAQS